MYGYNETIVCIDVNECVEGSAQCSQSCTNTAGSYVCGCSDGYYLDTDGYTCNGN